MMLFLDLLAYSLALLVSLPLVILACECVLSLLPPKKRTVGKRTPSAIIVPAHNEELGLSDTLRNIFSQTMDGDRVILVADNCTDRTAEIGRSHNAEVVVRNDLTRRGKGFALDAGMNYLKDSVAQGAVAPQVVIILDADCTFNEGALDSLVSMASVSNRPLQALYLMHDAAESTPKSRMSAFAFLTKNQVRPRGLDRIGLSVPLTGSGMAFPWSIARELKLATSEIVEDLELGLRLALEGRGPQFCEVARVDSFFPASAEAAADQRKRWEHGFLGQMKRKLPLLFLQSLRGNVHAMGAALDLLVPPLSLLVMISALAGALLTGHYLISATPWPFVIFILSCGFAAISLFAIWFRFGQKTLPLNEILYVPQYAGSKIAMYLAVPFHAEREWKRAAREELSSKKTESQSVIEES